MRKQNLIFLSVLMFIVLSCTAVSKKTEDKSFVRIENPDDSFFVCNPEILLLIDHN